MRVYNIEKRIVPQDLSRTYTVHTRNTRIRHGSIIIGPFHFLSDRPSSYCVSPSPVVCTQKISGKKKKKMKMFTVLYRHWTCEYHRSRMNIPTTSNTHRVHHIPRTETDRFEMVENTFFGHFFFVPKCQQHPEFQSQQLCRSIYYNNNRALQYNTTCDSRPESLGHFCRPTSRIVSTATSRKKTNKSGPETRKL